ncbi:MAG: phage DNA encapsidation protein [Aeriscardovia sp.]|nr:phage DNA encapsidation protein [Aeriscardovia sp.]
MDSLNNISAGNTYRYLDACAGDFISLVKILSYGKPWMFLTGSRSVGKSTGISIFHVIDFLKNGKKFIYTRRTKDETLLTCNTFYSNAIEIINRKTDFKIKKFYYEAGKYYIQMEGEESPKECGMIIPLSQEQKYKSSNLSGFCNLVYDEFIASDPSLYLGSKDYPDREYNALISLYQTIDRGIDRPFRNETRFFFAANTTTIYNPIFLKLGISDYIEDHSRFISPKKALWVLNQIPEVKATETIKDSFAYMLSDDFNRKYSYENKGRDTDDFIKRPPANRRLYHCTLSYKGSKYGVYSDFDRCDYYIDNPQEGHKIISLDAESHTQDDLIMITSWNEIPIMGSLLIRFKRGKLFFGNGRIKTVFYKYFKLSP